MDKLIKVGFTLLLVASIAAPGSFAIAKTIEDVPTTESSILSRTADPTTVSKQRLEQEKSEDSENRSEESTEDSTKGTETTKTSEEKASSSKGTKESNTESSTETTEPSKDNKKQNRAGGSPRADTDFLIEGKYGVDDPDTYDIDEKLSEGLRMTYMFPESVINIDFKGRGKAPGKLTFGDMKTLKNYYICSSNTNSAYTFELSSSGQLKGLEYAENLKKMVFENLSESFLNNNGTLDTSRIPYVEELEVLHSHFDKYDFTVNPNLKKLRIMNNQTMKAFSLNSTRNLEHLQFESSSLTAIDLSAATDLKLLAIKSNPIKKLDISSNSILEVLEVTRTKIKEIDVSNNKQLMKVEASSNEIRDITSASVLKGINGLSVLNFKNQTLYVPVKLYTGETETEIKWLKTTNQKGLSVTKGTVLGSPILNTEGDIIKIKNISGSSVDGKYINFTYDISQIAEGEGMTNKGFSGRIYLYSISEMSSELKVDRKTANKDETAKWSWNLKNLTSAIAKNATATLNLPAGLSIVSGSVKVDDAPVSDNYLNGTIDLGDFPESAEKKITFETTVSGNPDQWLEAVGKVFWEDSGPESPYEVESKDAVKVQDEEETYTPLPTEEMGLLSVPIRFDYGIKDMSNTSQSFSLSPDLYQTNTNVVNNGFYTRVKDDRSTSTGWSLTAQLSSFVNVTDTSSGMPDSYGTALRFEDLSIEGVKDRDTPQESIDPGAAGAPNLLKTSEKIVAGDSAKTLVSAEPYEGQGTWQLRIPFDKVFLDLPAYAGKEHTNFQAKLTWSLNDTPTP